MKHFLTVVILLMQISLFARADTTHIVHVKIQEEIAPAASRLVKKALVEAEETNADVVLLELDTYGGLVVDADSIRKNILAFEKPVYAYINLNAASAGALISIACDKIFMQPGATMGSSTVVNGSGEVLPDKYQSYMRSIMRATAESHGRDTIILDGDTTFKYYRDPRIAEAMVDDRIAIQGIIDSGRIVAFTTTEALRHGYCEAEVNSVDDIVAFLQRTTSLPKQEARFTEVKKTTLDKIIGFLALPGLQGALLMIIFWGIFFEIRTPGIGFPLAAAVLAALLYFAPLYLDGLAANWEILLFIVGIILIALEIFVIPGFGVAGVTGILFTVGSLILSLVRNVDFDFSQAPDGQLGNAALIVLFALIGFIVGAFLFGRGMTSSPLFKKMVLTNTLKDAKAGIHTNARAADDLMGHIGIAHTDIRPIGKARIDDVIMDVKSMGVFISKGSSIRVVSRELGYWVVEKA